MASDIPDNLQPELIGETVTFQVFNRKGEGEIAHESLKKYVGTLQGYHHHAKLFVFKLRGFDPIRVDFQAQYLEVYPHYLFERRNP